MISCRHIVSLRSLLNTLVNTSDAHSSKAKTTSFSFKRYGIIYTCFVFLFYLVLTWGKVWRPSAMLICATCSKKKKRKKRTQNYSPPWRKTKSAAYDTMEDHVRSTVPQVLERFDIRSVGLTLAWSIIVVKIKVPIKICIKVVAPYDFTFSESYTSYKKESGLGKNTHCNTS